MVGHAFTPIGGFRIQGFGMRLTTTSSASCRVLMTKQAISLLLTTAVALLVSGANATDAIKSEQGLFSLNRTIVETSREDVILRWGAIDRFSLGSQLMFSRDGNTLIALYESRNMRLFNLPDKSEPFSLRLKATSDHCFAFSSDGKMAMFESTYSRREDCWITLRERIDAPPLADRVLKVPDADSFLALVCDQRVPELKAFSLGEVVAKLKADEGAKDVAGGGLWHLYPRSAAFTPDGDSLVAQVHFHEDELPTFDHVQIWDVPSTTVREAFRVATWSKAILSPDGTLLAYRRPHSSIALRNMDSFDIAQELSSTKNLRPACFSSDGNLLFAIDDGEGSVVIWDIQQKAFVDLIRVPGRKINFADASPNNGLLAVGCRDGSLYLFEAMAETPGE